MKKFLLIFALVLSLLALVSCDSEIKEPVTSSSTGEGGVTGSLISESQETRAKRDKTNANIKRNFFISIHVHRAHRKEFS